MELHAFYVQGAMADRHDLPLGGEGCHLEIRGQRLRLSNERVITRDLARCRQPFEESPGIVGDPRGLAVHQATGAHDFASEDFHDGLVAEAYPQHRDLAGERADHVHRDAGVIGGAGPGGDAQVRGCQLTSLFDGQRIVAVDAYVGSQNQKRLHQVVSEGVVVVDQQKTRGAHMPS